MVVMGGRWACQGVTDVASVPARETEDFICSFLKDEVDRNGKVSNDNKYLVTPI